MAAHNYQNESGSSTSKAGVSLLQWLTLLLVAGMLLVVGSQANRMECFTIQGGGTTTKIDFKTK